MAKLRFPDKKPPCGWRYRQAETDLVITEGTRFDLANRMHLHRRHRKLPRKSFEECHEDIIQQIAETLNYDPNWIIADTTIEQRFQNERYHNDQS